MRNRQNEKKGVAMGKKKKEMTLREYLSKTKDYRIQEEMTRPRIEIWPNPWAEQKGQNKFILLCS